MLYALDNSKTEKILAEKGLKGFCSFCGNELIAKCGKLRINHWAHKPKEEEHCDTWRENESEWHLDWKLKFPKKNCEVTLEYNSEKHRADIFTDKGMVIEIQRSLISPEDIIKRENFYKQMVWIVYAAEIYEHFHLDARWSIDKEVFEIIKNYKIYTRIETTQDFRHNSKTDEFEPFDKPIYFIRFDKVPHEKIRNLLKSKNFYWNKTEWKTESNYFNSLIIKSLFDRKRYVKFLWKWSREVWQYAKCPVYLDFGNQYLFEIISGKGCKTGFGYFVDKETFINENKH